MSKISVVVPVYKVEKFLRQCLDSITNQTYRDLEIILVDDGSPDRGGQYVMNMRKKINVYRSSMSKTEVCLQHETVH